MKKCRSCKLLKLRKDFYPSKSTKDKRRTECKSCHKILRDSNKDKHRWRVILKLYGLSKMEYEEMYKTQKGLCAICEKINVEGRPLYVDHDHVTGRIRGLLCINCNMGIGAFSDNIQTLYRAADYLDVSTWTGISRIVKHSINSRKQEKEKSV